ncbi:hypothetical protein FFLO_04759 [Filobasidium floriforme]|uniref:Uncharacterized protein n=1 Tax=Filobasidium floriforme TaxID=5210 RepID=A0A8K0NM25_9TREE|nr:uncharacterized protein HD553DRAFT_324836 [Filobasidium floriforme]KAG7530852.1 hypothetical protein FFLO_04759 [Filobasidium floriforme]KAH8082537.1 hypothetical protein HD553DRAFT_324836 [Filobasidium floriforme]
MPTEIQDGTASSGKPPTIGSAHPTTKNTQSALNWLTESLHGAGSTFSSAFSGWGTKREISEFGKQLHEEYVRMEKMGRSVIDRGPRNTRYVWPFIEEFQKDFNTHESELKAQGGRTIGLDSDQLEQLSLAYVSIAPLYGCCILLLSYTRYVPDLRLVQFPSSEPPLPNNPTHYNSQTSMSSNTGSSLASKDGSSLTGSGTIDPTSTSPASDLPAVEPSESCAKRLYGAWRAGLGPTYGIDTKRGDEFMQMFDAHPHDIKCLRKDVVAGEDEEDRRERNRQRDRLRSAYLKTSPSGKAYWSTEQHEEFKGHVVGSK